MKAWYLDINNDPDQGAFIVFANTRNQARGMASSNDLMYDSWLDVQAIRAKQYDDLWDSKRSELALRQWKNGWRWFDVYDMPNDGVATDEEFLEWWHMAFDKTCEVCGKTNEFVSLRFCGYDLDIHGRYKYETICDDCEHEHLMDI
jgi:hypothetical protein